MTTAVDVKTVLGRDGSKYEVPSSTTVNDHKVWLGWGFSLGEDCTIEDGSSIQGQLGDRCEIGRGVQIESRSVLGNDVTVGPKTTIGESCTIGDDVAVGDGCEIGNRVRIQPGVIIPDNWYIPNGTILNPGPGSTPVPITPQASFRCNVQGNIRAGGSIY